MDRLLIAVHGMGTNRPGWSDTIREKLDAVAGSGDYAAFKGKPSFSSRIAFEEVCYDSVFERYVGKWADQKAEFRKFMDAQAALPGAQQWDVGPLLGWITGAGLPHAEAAKGFFWATLLDAVLYKGTRDLREEVRASVMAQILGHIHKHNHGQLYVSILAHSLGTIVVHDVLHLVASDQAGPGNVFTSKKFTYDNLFMVADVCVLGPPDLVQYSPKNPGYFVRPRTATNPGQSAYEYCTERLFSFRHEWDPFVRWAQFEPSTWGKDWGENFFSVSLLNHWHEMDPHSFEHYLDHPRVHVPIINNVLGYDAISGRETADAIARYPEYGNGACTAAVQELKDSIAALEAALKPGSVSLPKIAQAGSAFYAAAKTAAQKCKEAINV